jgi:Zn-dependent protease
MPTRRGSIRIFRFLGVDVYLHYSWLIWAIIRYKVQFLHFREYSSPIWYGVEYLALFSIVLMHEFGHALACRQVGGQANLIVLWPLGGVAYVSPPQRPGAMLWSIAAGPLVNVALIPVFSVFWYCSHLLGWPETYPNLNDILEAVWTINFGLLVFNMLPIFPLDGGQILRSILWFFLGRANSLLIASIIGFVGVAGFGVFILLTLMDGFTGQALWLGVMDTFVAMTCWRAMQQALALSRLEKVPRRAEFRCPSCHLPPPVGEFWGCSRCRKTFDTFATRGFCPHCNAEYNVTACPFCHSARPMPEWQAFQTPSGTTLGFKTD